MPNSYPRDGIFNQHLTTIKDSYILTTLFFSQQLPVVNKHSDGVVSFLE